VIPIRKTFGLTKIKMQFMNSAFSWRTGSLTVENAALQESSSGSRRLPCRVLHQLRLGLNLLRQKSGQLLHREVIVLPPSEMNLCRNLENQDSDVARNATTVELVRIKFLRKLNQRQPSVFTRVVHIPSTGKRIKRQQIGGRLVLLNKRHIVNMPLIFRERRP